MLVFGPADYCSCKLKCSFMAKEVEYLGYKVNELTAVKIKPIHQTVEPAWPAQIPSAAFLPLPSFGEEHIVGTRLLTYLGRNLL